ncbi:MAG TPA: hypothetical protein VNA65_12110 [Candidatus Dormibacteraeota bacterium]|nr:hypothetical protein [Candidatus Dormibacteraeota bacterium]
MRRVLESERRAEQEFVDRARESERAPKGWPASLVMFHIGMWRERMRDALAAIANDQPYDPPGNADAINEAELPHGIGTPLSDASARADHLLTEILELYEKIGEKPINWFGAPHTTDAVLRNSFAHPRRHLCDYTSENGDPDAARQLLENGIKDLSEVSASEFVMKPLSGLRGDLANPI